MVDACNAVHDTNLPVCALWSRMNFRTHGLLEDALKNTDTSSYVPLKLAAYESARCEILRVLERDEAWLASCEERSAYLIATLQLPLSWRMRNHYEACQCTPSSTLAKDRMQSDPASDQSTTLDASSVVEQRAQAAQSVNRKGLTQADAIVIYLAQLGLKDPHAAANIASEYGISAKAVRDVWTHKSWISATTPFLPLVYGWRSVTPGSMY